MKPWKQLAATAAFAALALLAGSCNLGSPITPTPRNGTEVEGLTGTLVLLDGTPAPGTWVRVFAAGGASAAAKTGAVAGTLALDSLQTNSTGGFHFPDLPSGTYNLAAFTRRGDTALALYLPGIVVTGKTNLGTDTLLVAGSLRVEVRTDNVPLAGAYCAVGSGAWQAVSDDSGACVITGVAPGTFQVTVSYPPLQVVVSGNFVVAPGTATAGGQVNLSATASTIPLLIAPAQNATAVPRNPTLTWMTASGATSYRVQVAADSLFHNLVRNDTVPATITAGLNSRIVGPLAAGTKYHWRVTAMGPGGSFVSAPRRFTTEAAAVSVPNPPVPVSPANFSTEISRNPVLTWNAAGGAMAYRVQVSTNVSFTSLVVNDSAVTGTSRAIGTLAAGTNYYWRVSARNTIGTSAYSPVFSFTTGTAGDSLPPAPVLQAPAHNATGVSTSPTLSWLPNSGTLTYRLQVSMDTLFATLVVNDSLGPTLTQAGILTRSVGPLASGVSYYWRVIAANGAGSRASMTRRFTTGTPDTNNAVPAVPVLSTPQAFATGMPRNLTLTWLAAARATSYQVQVSTNTAFTALFLQDSSATGTSRSISSLAGNAEYYWRVRARNAAGVSAWSEIRSFTTSGADSGSGTVTVPNAPMLSAPAAFAPNVSRNPTLVWNPAPGATSYHLQISTSAAFATLVRSDSNVTVTSRTVGTFAGSTEYFWRVRARNAAGTSAWSEIRAFTTVGDTGATPVIPPTPAPTSPENLAVNVSRSPTLSWSASAGATAYRVQVSTNSGFTSLVKNDSNFTQPQRGLNDLAANTVYYWRVSAKNAAGVSPWSPVFRFTTGATTGAAAWVSRTSGTTTALYGVASADSGFIAVGAAGIVRTSPDGVAWTAQTSGTTNPLYAVAKGGVLIAAVGEGGTIVTTPSGSVWTTRISGTTNHLYGVAWNGSLFVAVGANGTILRSTSGGTWTTYTSGTTNHLYAVTWSGSQFVAGGASGTILTSPDGVTWTRRSSSTTTALYALNANDSTIVAVGAGGIILTSSNGVSWLQRASGTTSELYGATTKGSTRILVGAAGTILTSSNNGVAWSAAASGVTSTLYAAARNNTRAVAVGNAGVIVSQP
jgi:hypothetical protein